MKVSQVLFSTLQHGNPKIIDEELTRLVIGEPNLNYYLSTNK